jgi:hypothetical protein
MLGGILDQATFKALKVPPIDALPLLGELLWKPD